MHKALIGAVVAAGMLAAGPLSAQGGKLVTQGVTDTEILIGTHTDLSGPLAGVGVEVRDAMLMRIEEINAAGGIHGRKFRLIVEDSGYDAKKAVLAAQKLVERDKVFALVFPFGTGPALATLPITREKGIPLLFAGSGAVAFHTPPSESSFGYFLPDHFFMRLGIDYAARELKPKRVGLIYQGDDYGEAMLAGAKESLARHKIDLVETVSYKPGATDFSAQVAKLKAANIDLLLLGTALRETAGVARERQKLDWDVKMLGGFPVYNTISVALAKGAMEGTYAVGQNTDLLSRQRAAAGEGVLRQVSGQVQPRSRADLGRRLQCDVVGCRSRRTCRARVDGRRTDPGLLQDPLHRHLRNAGSHLHRRSGTCRRSGGSSRRCATGAGKA